jgi:hypothetical protein
MYPIFPIINLNSKIQRSVSCSLSYAQEDQMPVRNVTIGTSQTGCFTS